MAVLTSRHNLLRDVFRTPPDKGILRRLIRESKVDMVLSAPTAKSQLMSLAAQGPEEYHELFELLITFLVLNRTEREVEERRLKNFKCNSLQELFDSEPWQESLELHEAKARTGESRDDFFGRAFGHLLSAEPAALKIYDGYFMGAALKEREVIPWLFRHLQARKTSAVKILTANQSDERGTGSPKEVALRFAENTAHAMADAEFTGNVALYVHNELIHDRFLEFLFSQGSIAFNLGKGIDSFGIKTFEAERMVSSAISGWDLAQKLQQDNVRPRWEDEFVALESEALPENLKLFLPTGW